MQEASESSLSPIVLGELRSGFLKGGRAAENERSSRGSFWTRVAAAYR